jgi:hypothetical protein
MSQNTAEATAATVSLSKGLGIGYGTLLAGVTDDIHLENGTEQFVTRGRTSIGGDDEPAQAVATPAPDFKPGIER